MFRSNSANSRARAAINASIYSDSLVQKYIENTASFPELLRQIDLLEIQVGNIYINPDVSNGIIDMNTQVESLRIRDLSNTLAVTDMYTSTEAIDARLNELLIDAIDPNNFSITKKQTINGELTFSGNVYLSRLTTQGLVYNDLSGKLLSKPLLTNADISPDANISDTKLNTITTVGKVLPSATNANTVPSPLSIVLRDGSGDILALTPADDVSDNRVATTRFVQNIIGKLVDTAPETLNTLNELANAIGGDASFSQTIFTALAAKAPIANPLFTGNVYSTRMIVTPFIGKEGIVKVDENGRWTSGTITQADISTSVLTNAQLQTITTPGKVANSATTATTEASANAILLRGPSGEWVNPVVGDGPIYSNTVYSGLFNTIQMTNFPYNIDHAPAPTRAQREATLKNWRFSSSSVKNIAVTNVYERFGTAFAPHSSGVVRSDNGGASWSGISWPAGSAAYAITYIEHGGLWLFVGDNLVRTTTNFSTYSTISPLPTTAIWRHTTYSREITTSIAVGHHVAMYTTLGNATTWTLSAPTPSGEWVSSVWSPDLSQFVAVGLNAAMYSPNGVSWTACSDVPEGSWTSVVWADALGLYCAVAPTGIYRVMVSPNGIQWYGQNVPEMNQWNYVTWCPDFRMLCAVSSNGTNRLIRSYDGLNWKGFPIPLNTWRCIVWSRYHSTFSIIHTSSTGEMLASSLMARVPHTYTFTPIGVTGKEYTFSGPSIDASAIYTNQQGNAIIRFVTWRNTTNPIYTNTNFVITNALGVQVNRAVNRVLTCMDASGIGDYMDTSAAFVSGTMVTGNIWTTSGTCGRIGSFTLSPGKWNITYGSAIVPFGATSTVSSVSMFLSTVDASSGGIIPTTEYYDYESYSVTQGGTYPLFPHRATINVLATTTYYLNGIVTYDSGITAIAAIGTGGEDSYMYAYLTNTYYLDIPEIAKYFLQYPYAQGSQTMLDIAINGSARAESRWTVNSSYNATDLSMAPLTVFGGASVGGNVVIGGNIYHTKGTDTGVSTKVRALRLRDISGTLAPVGGVAEGYKYYISGEYINYQRSETGNVLLNVKSADGLASRNMGINYARVDIPHNAAVTTTTNGALRVAGGISTQGSIYMGNLYATNPDISINIGLYSSSIPSTSGSTNGVQLRSPDLNVYVYRTITPISGINSNTYTNENGTYISSASSVYFASSNFLPWRLFGSNAWASDVVYNNSGIYTGAISTVIGGTTISGEWAQIQFPFSFILQTYSITGRNISNLLNEFPKEFYIAGSTNGTTWNQLDYVFIDGDNSPPIPQIYTRTIANSVPYSYYRIVIRMVFVNRGIVVIDNWDMSGLILDLNDATLSIAAISVSNETLNMGVNSNLFGKRVNTKASAYISLNVRTDNTQLFELLEQDPESQTVQSPFTINRVGNTIISSGAQSTTTDTGALTIRGGIGIGGRMNIIGNARIYDTGSSAFSIVDMSGTLLRMGKTTIEPTTTVFNGNGVVVDGVFPVSIENINQTTMPSLPYAPNNFSGLRLWFDATDAQNMVFDGSALLIWADKSGFNGNAILTPDINRSSLVYRYGFDEISGTLFANSATGTLVYDAYGFNGASVNTSDFKVGTGSLRLLKLNSQYIHIPTFDITTTGITVLFWFKHNSTDLGVKIFEFGNGPYDNIGYSPISGATAFSGFTQYISGGPSIIQNATTNTWHFFAWTIPYVSSGNTTHTFYYDNQISTVSAPYPPIKPMTNNIIGKHIGTGYDTSAVSVSTTFNSSTAAYSPYTNKIYIFNVTTALSTISVYDISSQAVSTISIGTSYTYMYAIFAPNNGKIYVTTTTSTVLVFNPADNTSDTIILTGGTGPTWERGDYVSHNKTICYIPRGASNVLVIDTVTNTQFYYGPTFTGENYIGSVYVPSTKKVYGVPFNARYICSFDTVTNVVDLSAIDVGFTASSKYVYGVLSPNQKIYCFPHTQTTVLVIDPSSNTVTLPAGLNIGAQRTWTGAVSPYNNYIYCSPKQSNIDMYVINTTNDTFFRVPFASSGNYGTTLVSSNYNIYSIPQLVSGPIMRLRMNTIYLDATIDDFRWYNRVLTSAEILNKTRYGPTLYNGLPGVQIEPNQGFSADLPAGSLAAGTTGFVVFQKNGSQATFETPVARTVGTFPGGFDIYNSTRIFGRGVNQGTTAELKNIPFDIRTATGLNIMSFTLGSVAYTMSSGTTYTEWVNGASTVSTTNVGGAVDSANKFYIGMRGDFFTSFSGVIAEIILYNRTLSSGERQLIEGYLAEKWAMRNSLAETHPYKTAMPRYRILAPLRNQVVSNATAHTYIRSNANLDAQIKVVTQTFSAITPNTVLRPVSGSSLWFNYLGRIYGGVQVRGCFFYADSSQTNCEFGIYLGSNLSPLLAVARGVTISAGLNYIPFSSTWVVPETNIYYFGIMIPPKMPEVNFLALPTGNYYSYGYSLIPIGTFRSIAQITTDPYTALPDSILSYSFTSVSTNLFVGIYAVR